VNIVKERRNKRCHLFCKKTFIEGGKRPKYRHLVRLFGGCNDLDLLPWIFQPLHRARFLRHSNSFDCSHRWNAHDIQMLFAARQNIFKRFPAIENELYSKAAEVCRGLRECSAQSRFALLKSDINRSEVCLSVQLRLVAPLEDYYTSPRQKTLRRVTWTL